MKNIIEKYRALSTRHQATIIFCLIAFISVILWISGDTPQTQVANNDNALQITQDSKKIDAITETNLADNQESNVIEKLNNDTPPSPTAPSQSPQKTYSVVRIVDGDTIDVSIDGKVDRLRMIGINTPETVDPRKPVECFGVEASNKAKSFLSGKKVSLESDTSQGERDKYDRLLRYIFLEDGTNLNLLMIKQGYAYEYTYGVPYKYQSEFKKAQAEAIDGKIGLWGDVCQTQNTTQSDNKTSTPTPTPTNNTNSCTIKGNISSSGEKIYHIIGCRSYSKTVIDESKGEKWFCLEQEAVGAGWRKALNCN